jgi:hypothetical protein
MRFWTREIAGWLLLVLGLYVFYICFVFLRSQQIVEAASMTVIGIFLFRGGIHLLKVAVAAQVCLEARDQALEGRAAGTRPQAALRAPVSRTLPRQG